MENKKERDFRYILESESELHRIQDADILLESVLAEACKVVNADAGSIYVAEGNELFIKYSRNNTKQRTLAPGQKLLYSFFSFPINEKSIAGYAALTGQLVHEPDMYNIDPSKPYTFNAAPDKASGYRTTSNMAVPLIALSGNVLGVLQVLNKVGDDGSFIPFDEDDQLAIKHFASTATTALEHAYLTRAMIMRMIKLSEMRDPKETGTHVNRVSSYAVEIYDRWAYLHNIPEKEMNTFRDTLKIAAMLHDIGKVSISDMILKKPGKFTEEEYQIMQSHTWIGASLFSDSQSALDKMSLDVAMTHHENWDGSGYPGWIDPVSGKTVKEGPLGKPQGRLSTEIPIAGRIVALADVFDALSCRRVYKQAWTPEDVLDEIKRCRGTKFDPDVVDAFFDVLPNIRQIQSQYPDVE